MPGGAFAFHPYLSTAQWVLSALRLDHCTRPPVPVQADARVTRVTWSHSVSTLCRRSRLLCHHGHNGHSCLIAGTAIISFSREQSPCAPPRFDVGATPPFGPTMSLQHIAPCTSFPRIGRRLTRAPVHGETGENVPKGKHLKPHAP